MRRWVLGIALSLILAVQPALAAPLVPQPVIGKAVTTQNWEVGPITFSDAEEGGEPVHPSRRFVQGVREIYAFFDYSGLVADDALEGVWYWGNEKVLSQRYTMAEIFQSDNVPADGVIWFIAGFADADPGVYTFELYVNDKFARSGKFLLLSQEGYVRPPEPTPAPTPTVPPPSIPSIRLQQQVPVTITIPHPDRPHRTLSVPIVVSVTLQSGFVGGEGVTVQAGAPSGGGDADMAR